MSDGICKWCRRKPATEHDHDALPEGDDGGLCWREWNDQSDCHAIEDLVKEASPELLEAAQRSLQVFINQGWEDDLIAAKELKAAIAKATGKQP